MEEVGQMKVLHEKLNALDLLKLVGRLDASTSKEFKNKIGALTEENRFNVLLDLSELDFIDSSGLGALVGALRTVNNHGGDIKIAATKPQVRAIFELTRLHRVFAIFNDRAAAEKSFKE
jgi:anti-sigma B factor antagonist